jgi:hypothetical protein
VKINMKNKSTVLVLPYSILTAFALHLGENKINIICMQSTQIL